MTVRDERPSPGWRERALALDRVAIVIFLQLSAAGAIIADFLASWADRCGQAAFGVIQPH